VASTSPGSGATPGLDPGNIYTLAVQDGGFSPGADSRFGGDSTATVATAIALAESNGQPGAHGDVGLGRSGSYGLWQIFSGTWTPGDVGLPGGKYDDLYNPVANAKAAGIVYKKQGFNAWSTYKNGAYKLYLPQARAASKSAAQSGITANFGASKTNDQGAITNGTGIGSIAGAAADKLNPLNALSSLVDWIKGGAIRAAYFICGGALLLLFIWKAGA
jgi:hypothetical protein